MQNDTNSTATQQELRSPRNRKGETLFIDARKIGSMISRTQKELTSDDIQKIATTYQDWKSEGSSYEDTPGYCKSIELAEIAKHDYVLTPGRYGIPFETKMKELSDTLYQQMEEAKELDATICKNLEELGYGR